MRQPAVARLESGEHNPSFDTLLRLSGMLGIEFMLHIVPTTRPPLWADPTRSQARVMEKVRSATARSEATVAAS